MITNGFAFGWSDLVTIGVNFPYASSFIYITSSGTSGDIVYMNTAGVAQWLPGCLAGMLYPIGAASIVASATVNGVLRTTTATGMAYCSAGTP